jgi:hypothetical protein
MSEVLTERHLHRSIVPRYTALLAYILHESLPSVNHIFVAPGSDPC